MRVTDRAQVQESCSDELPQLQAVVATVFTPLAEGRLLGFPWVHFPMSSHTSLRHCCSTLVSGKPHRVFVVSPATNYRTPSNSLSTPQLTTSRVVVVTHFHRQDISYQTSLSYRPDRRLEADQWSQGMQFCSRSSSDD